MKINFNGHEIELTEDDLKKDVVEIKKDDMILIPKTDFDVRIKNESDSGYNRGKIAGEEMERKATRDAFGLEIEGKDRDKIIEGIKSKILKEANIEPNKALEEKNRLIDQLRLNITKAETEKSDLINQYTAKEKKMKLDSVLFSSIPDKAVNDSLNKNDIAAMFRANGYDISESDGKVVAMFNGEVVKNTTTLEPLPFADVVTKFVSDKKLITVDGRGAGDNSKKAASGSIEAFEKEMDDKGVKYGSKEYIDEMNRRIKDKTLKY
jgi:hypothetical protein